MVMVKFIVFFRFKDKMKVLVFCVYKVSNFWFYFFFLAMVLEIMGFVVMVFN